MTPCEYWGGTHRQSDGRPILGAAMSYAYRVLWRQERGPLPSEVILHHRCENPWCMNLDHLEPITQGVHIAEHGLPGDWGQAAKTHCPAGHPYSPENTYHYTRADGRRERHCRICRRENKRRFRARREGATP